MQVILQQNVPHLGLVGDVVDVAAGYFRNFLAPRDLALTANPKSLKQAAHQKKLIEAKKQKEKTIALGLKTKLETQEISIAHPAGEGGKLFGSITTQEIVQTLKGLGYLVDRRHVKIEAPIKAVGEHPIEVKLHSDVSVSLKLKVTAKS